jgi:mono/diheme cytochrome c family protein
VEDKVNKQLPIAILGILAVIAVLVLWPKATQLPQEETTLIPDGFVIPSLNATQKLGQSNFNKSCASCHGDYGLGSANGPPLMHRIYEPNHHGDGAFFLAALNGVRAHHWKFGDMPPVDGITETEIAPIVAYVRALQQANGVF